jgi:hypothetical protein
MLVHFLQRLACSDLRGWLTTYAWPPYASVQKPTTHIAEQQSVRFTRTMPSPRTNRYGTPRLFVCMDSKPLRHGGHTLL